ncbi:MAG: hypothetical protein ACREOO_30680 [bacterium]
MLSTTLLCSMGAALFLLFSSCSKENKSAAQGADKLPSDFRLVFGEGGGFTGMWQGYTIDSSGAIYSWQGKLAGENPRSAGKLSATQIKALWQEIQKADLLGQELNERGNMTSIMRVTANGVTKELAWIPRMDATATAASPPQQVQQYCRKLVEKTIKK